MRLIPILTAVTLFGCSYVVPQTAMSLYRLSPLTADPAEIRAAVELPIGVDVRPGGATLTFAATRTDTGQSKKGLFVLDVVETPQGMKLFALKPQDRPDYVRLRDMFNDWETEAPRATNGTFSIAVAACKTGSGPNPDATFSVFVATAADAPLSVVIKDAPIAEALEATRSAGAPDNCD